ncbi:MAG: PAS domain S-box protein [Burkholderiales bacterium]|nr:MAG: PAS domain S-box protein [Burkholderiales bacterium]
MLHDKQTELFENAFHHAPIGMALVALDGEFLKINDSFCQLTGYPVSEILAGDFQAITHPEDLAADLNLLRRLRDGEITGYQMDKRYVRKDGGIVWANLSVSLVREADGAPKHYVAQVQDLTARRQAEDAVKEAMRVAEDATKAKSDFLANMSHEIRTPLTTIIGYAGLLGDSAADPAFGRTCASRIETASRLLLSIVNDVLDLSRVEAGAMEIRGEPTDWVRTVRDSVALFERQAEEKGVRLVFEEPSDTSERAVIDEGRLKQVLVNLVGNALKFTDEGQVTVRAAYVSGKLQLEVADTGPGIPVHQHELVFEPFWQGRAEGAAGSGLGLAIARRLVTAMGGAGEHNQAPELMLEGVRVLVGEDNEANRALARVILRTAGAIVTEAIDGRDTLEKALSQPFDVMLVDLRMPSMTGRDVIENLRAQPGYNQNTAAIAFSADGHLDDYASLGFDGFLAKPFSVRLLLAKVAQARFNRISAQGDKVS